MVSFMEGRTRLVLQTRSNLFSVLFGILTAGQLNRCPSRIIHTFIKQVSHVAAPSHVWLHHLNI